MKRAIALFSLALIACDSDSTTTGKRIILEAKIAASPESKAFTNAVGWTVTMTKALVATGPLAYYDGETLFAQSAPWRLRDLFAIKVAHAHPGHYVAGTTKGEFLGSTSADLLAGATLGTGNGISGPVRSATFSFDAPAKGPFAGELGSNAIVLEGSATKGDATRLFRAEVTLDETKGADGRPEVEGCPFIVTDMEGDGVVSVSIKVPQWFDQVDFEPLAASTDGKPVLLSTGIAHNQLVRGTKASIGYVFSYAPR